MTQDIGAFAHITQKGRHILIFGIDLGKVTLPRIASENALGSALNPTEGSDPLCLRRTPRTRSAVMHVMDALSPSVKQSVGHQRQSSKLENLPLRQRRNDLIKPAASRSGLYHLFAENGQRRRLACAITSGSVEADEEIVEPVCPPISSILALRDAHSVSKA